MNFHTFDPIDITRISENSIQYSYDLTNYIPEKIKITQEKYKKYYILHDNGTTIGSFLHDLKDPNGKSIDDYAYSLNKYYTLYNKIFDIADTLHIALEPIKNGIRLMCWIENEEDLEIARDNLLYVSFRISKFIQKNLN